MGVGWLSKQGKKIGEKWSLGAFEPETFSLDDHYFNHQKKNKKGKGINETKQTEPPLQFFSEVYLP